MTVPTVSTVVGMSVVGLVKSCYRILKSNRELGAAKTKRIKFVG